MALTLSGTNGVVGAGFTLDASGASVTAGVGTFGSIGAGTSVAAAGLHGTMPTIDGHALTSINSAQIVVVCTSGLTKTGGFGKILVMLSCQVQTNPSGTYNGQCDMSINRSINGGSYTAIAAQNQGNYIQETYASYHDNSLNINLLDSPSYSLGNAITYKMQVKSADTSVTTRVNVTCGGVTNGASKLILVEVAA